MTASTEEVLGMLMTEEQLKKNNMKKKERINENITNVELESASGGSEQTDRDLRRREIKDREPRQRILRRR